MLFPLHIEGSYDDVRESIKGEENNDFFHEKVDQRRAEAKI